MWKKRIILESSRKLANWLLNIELIIITKLPNLIMLTANDKQTTAQSISREVNLPKNS